MVSNEELRQLQAELLAEEMKLALMKQVRQSQRDLHVMAAQQQAAAMVVQNQLVPSAQPLAFAQLQGQSAPVAQQSQNQLLLTAQQARHSARTARGCAAFDECCHSGTGDER